MNAFKPPISTTMAAAEGRSFKEATPAGKASMPLPTMDLMREVERLGMEATLGGKDVIEVVLVVVRLEVVVLVDRVLEILCHGSAANES